MLSFASLLGSSAGYVSTLEFRHDGAVQELAREFAVTPTSGAPAVVIHNAALI